MPEETFHVEIEGAKEIEKALDAMAFAVTPRGMGRVLKDVGMVLKRRSMTSFKDQKAPEFAGTQVTQAAGKAWKPLAEATLAARRSGKKRGRGTKILQNTGTGKRSVTMAVDTANISVTVGTALKYMVYQHYGTVVNGRPHIPARPFIGYAKSDISTILMILAEHLERAAGG